MSRLVLYSHTLGVSQPQVLTPQILWIRLHPQVLTGHTHRSAYCAFPEVFTLQVLTLPDPHPPRAHPPGSQAWASHTPEFLHL